MLRSQMNADTVLPVQGTVIVDRAERLSLKETVLLQEKRSAPGAADFYGHGTGRERAMPCRC